MFISFRTFQEGLAGHRQTWSENTCCKNSQGLPMECSVTLSTQLATLPPRERHLIPPQSTESKKPGATMLSCFGYVSPWWLLGPSYVNRST